MYAVHRRWRRGAAAISLSKSRFLAYVTKALGFCVERLASMQDDMPTVARFRGFRAAIPVNEHRPAHVHVTGSGGKAVFNLNCPSGPPILREAAGLTRAELGGIANELAKRLLSLCRKWKRIHGDY